MGSEISFDRGNRQEVDYRFDAIRKKFYPFFLLLFHDSLRLLIKLLFLRKTKSFILYFQHYVIYPGGFYRCQAKNKS